MSKVAHVQKSTPEQSHAVKLLGGSKTLMKAKFMTDYKWGVLQGDPTGLKNTTANTLQGKYP